MATSALCDTKFLNFTAPKTQGIKNQFTVSEKVQGTLINRLRWKIIFSKFAINDPTCIKIRREKRIVYYTP